MTPSMSDFVVHVAPYVGAWIETDVAFNETDFSESHPTWVRGLKL